MMGLTDDREDDDDSHGITPLHMAAAEGHVEKVFQLLSQGANVNQLTEWEETPLHMATSKGTSLEVVKMLVKAGAGVNRRDKYGKTALMYSCLHGQDSIGNYLVRNGAEVNASDDYGTKPLPLAIRRKSLTGGLVCYLLKEDGGSYLLGLIKRMYRYPVKAKWDVLELYLSYPCPDINVKHKFDGATPLLRAVQTGDLKSALLLIVAGCKVDLGDYLGRTPMYWAFRRKLGPLVELLLAAGERIPCKDWMNIKRLLESKSPSMLERLLAMGAECPRLSIMCRRAFYDLYGTQTRNRIDELPLPPVIKEYLSFKLL